MPTGGERLELTVAPEREPTRERTTPRSLSALAASSIYIQGHYHRLQPPRALRTIKSPTFHYGTRRTDNGSTLIHSSSDAAARTRRSSFCSSPRPRRRTKSIHSALSGLLNQTCRSWDKHK
ncbi:hypothetical protein DPEC_G00253980 [Dallia pectoralis]|uniref:Uncharacterized protein n=1 Tax=Dallia pectoralis TaxID=75939 RepID=A0ACC2FU45_DALPE|nr:hypothetical protein DPEC_G00253980 [Dallia pectoralis]